MALTLDVLIIRAAEFLEDTAYGRWTAALITKYINDAQRDFARGARCCRKYSAALVVSATTPTYAFYTLPTDLLEIAPAGVWTTTSGQNIQLPPAAVSDLGDNWDNVSGDPPSCYINLLEFGMTELRVWPTPAAALTALKLYYVYLPADLTGSQSSPIPEQYHMALVYYAVAMCLMGFKQGSDQARSQAYMGMYERDLAHAGGKVAGSFANVAAVVPFRNV